VRGLPGATEAPLPSVKSGSKTVSTPTQPWIAWAETVRARMGASRRYESLIVNTCAGIAGLVERY
jgi:hypothetical protein